MTFQKYVKMGCCLSTQNDDGYYESNRSDTNDDYRSPISLANTTVDLQLTWEEWQDL